MGSTENRREKQISEGKMFALLSYLSILCIIPLVFKKDNDFVLSHGKQGLVLFIGEVMVFVMSVLFEWIFRPLVFIFGVFSLCGIVAVLKGEYVKLPVISNIAEKITL